MTKYLKSVSKIQKQILKVYKTQVTKRLEDYKQFIKNKQASQRTSNQKYQTSKNVNSSDKQKFHADQFVKMIYFMLRQSLYGQYQQSQQKLINQANQIYELNKQQLLSNLQFLYKTYKFPKVKTTEIRIQLFEQKLPSNKLKEYINDSQTIYRIHKLAICVFNMFDNYFYGKNQQYFKLQSYQNKQITPLYQILQYIETNYPWTRWKNILNEKHSYKQFHQLRLLEIIYISYLRNQITDISKTLNFKFKNKFIQKPFLQLLQQIRNHEQISKCQDKFSLTENDTKIQDQTTKRKKSNKSKSNNNPVRQQIKQQIINGALSKQKVLLSSYRFDLDQIDLSLQRKNLQSLQYKLGKNIKSLNKSELLQIAYMKQRVNEFNYGVLQNRRDKQIVFRCQQQKIKNVQMLHYYKQKQHNKKLLNNFLTIYQQKKSIKSHIYSSHQQC